MPAFKRRSAIVSSSLMKNNSHFGKPGKKTILSIALLFALALVSFNQNNSASQKTAIYYDRQTDRSIAAIVKLQRSIATAPRDSILSCFSKCRETYKRIEFLVETFAPLAARNINGPDLLKIEEDNPFDSLPPHGLQVLEGLLYAKRLDRNSLRSETDLLLNNIRRLRNDPDRLYYFRDDRIWQAVRSGIYRIITLDLTGFDVPLSNRAIPHVAEALQSIANITSFYRDAIPDTLYTHGATLFAGARGYLSSHKDFNSFDRLTFIRRHLNPISRWLRSCAIVGKYINPSNRTPVNPYAGDLFASDFFNISFFSPNEHFTSTPQRVLLGKKLFYDPILSGNGNRSCGSCHKPELGFSDGIAKQTDITGTKTLLRNTPTLWNAALQTVQFYDSRTRKLENQLSSVVHNTDEMNGSLLQAVSKLSADSLYHQLFTIAYPNEADKITEYNIANAISSYVRSLISLNSPFDRYIRGVSDTLNIAAKNGFNLFMGKAKCGTCHYAPLFNGLVPPLFQETESEIIGTPASTEKTPAIDSDEGKFRFTRIPLHKYAFKTSSLRNIALTAPYMHNGVFPTLSHVIDFYNDGGGAGRGIDLPTQTLSATPLGLSKSEKTDIIAFLLSLTDTTSVYLSPS
jgi:cytochrome c peroxidase